jgi:hypothetical protein
MFNVNPKLANLFFIKELNEEASIKGILINIILL